ncbi:unnamed protein product [Natator depressus]
MKLGLEGSFFPLLQRQPSSALEEETFRTHLFSLLWLSAAGTEPTSDVRTSLQGRRNLGNGESFHNWESGAEDSHLKGKARRGEMSHCRTGGVREGRDPGRYLIHPLLLCGRLQAGTKGV